MFGDSYFASRRKLLDVVEGIIDLAESTNAGLDDLAGREGLLGQVAKPFLFVVCGEMHAGKTSLLNALFGADLCESTDLPADNRVRWYRYGAEEKTIDHDAAFQECRRKIAFLKDYNLVDTPGTNSSIPGHQKATDHFIFKADFLFFVFPVSNPWAAATWDAIARLSEDRLERVVILLQMSDQQDARDLEVVLEHMRSLATQRIGVVPPLFPVSAKLALQAKSSDTLDFRVMQSSGFPPFENLISKRISVSPERYEIIRNIYTAADGVLKNIDKCIEEKNDDLRKQLNFIRQLEGEINHLRQKQSKGADGRYSALGEVFTEVVGLATEKLEDGLSLKKSFQSLIVGNRLPSEVEEVLLDNTQKTVEDHMAGDAQSLVKACAEHWESVIPRIESSLGEKPVAFDAKSKGFVGAEQSFCDELSQASRHSVIRLKLRSVLDFLMARRDMNLRCISYIALLFFIGAGSTGVMDFPSLVPLGFFALGGLTLVFLVIRMLITKRKVLELFAEGASSARRQFIDSLAEDYKTGVRQFFTEYTHMLEGIRRTAGESKQLVTKREEALNALFIRLKASEQEF